MTTQNHATTLAETLRSLDPDLLLDDGAETWDVDNLLDNLTTSERLEEVVVVELPDGRTAIHRLDARGYHVTPPLYVEHRGCERC